MNTIANILNEALKGARKTRIMYNCSLSHRQLQAYLKFLFGMGFLAFHSDLYKTTTKGLKFLDAYRTLQVLTT